MRSQAMFSTTSGFKNSNRTREILVALYRTYILGRSTQRDLFALRPLRFIFSLRSQLTTIQDRGRANQRMCEKRIARQEIKIANAEQCDEEQDNTALGDR